ncbi:MAG: CvpA family protein [Candidatus Omnitrophica bacterium]|nr:CvpA family protein [Candidatus Omnitrophota bacterium]
MDIAGRLEIIDIFFLIIFLRIVYVAASRGVLKEVCKLIGLISAFLFAFHFYPNLAEIVRTKISFINSNYLYSVSFFLIFIIIRIIFSLLNLIISLFLPKAEISAKKRAALLAAGAFRGLLLFSTIFFLFNLASFRPDYVKNSLSYNFSKQIAPKFYLISAKIFKGFNKTFTVNEKVGDYLKQKQPSRQGSIRI